MDGAHPAHVTSIGVRLPQAALAAVVGAVVALALVAWWDYEERGVRVVAVGTEHGLSVLVTSGHRRVLIVSGSSGRALGDTLGPYLRPLHRDLDVELLVGDTRASGREAARRWALGGDDRNGEEAIAASSSIALPGGVSIDITLEPGPRAAPRSWVAVVTHGRSVVAITGPATPWSTAAVAATRAGVVIVATSTTDDDHGSSAGTATLVPATARPAGRPAGAGVLRVFARQSIVLRLTSQGVELPDTVVEALGQRAGSPRASSRPLLGMLASNSDRTSLRSSADRRTSSPASAMALATSTALR